MPAINENMSGKNLNQNVNCSWATYIMLALKGKGHKLAEMVYVP
jgi:hypothetical protein